MSPAKRTIQNVCARSSCGHAADLHGDGGQCLVSTLTEDCPCIEYIEPDYLTTRVLMHLWHRTKVEFLDSHPDPPISEDGRPYWRPSKLGYCMRRHVMWRMGLEPTRPEPVDDEADKLQRFAWGNELQRMFARITEYSGLLIAEEAHVHDPELQISGSMDLVWGGEPQAELPARARYWTPEFAWAVRTFRGAVADRYPSGPVPVTGTELKTTNSNAVRRMWKEGARYDYRMQSGAYWLLAQRHPEQLPRPLDRFEIVVVGRDAVRPLVFGALNKDVEEALERIEELNEHWTAGTLPRCTCGETEGLQWETKYCEYRDPDDPTVCCGTSLLDKLAAAVEASAR